MTTENNTRTIVVPEAPSIPGLTFRHWRGRSDYVHMKAIFDDCKEVDGNEATWTWRKLRVTWRIRCTATYPPT